MRFWYRRIENLPNVIRASTGDKSFALNAPARRGTPGYMLWSKPGNWMLTVWNNGERVASIVFCVSVGTRDASPCRA